MAALWTQSDIDALKAAIAGGVLTVSYDGPAGKRQVTYQSLAEMRKLLAEMMRDVGAAPSHRVVAYSKGFR